MDGWTWIDMDGGCLTDGALDQSYYPLDGGLTEMLVVVVVVW